MRQKYAAFDVHGQIIGFHDSIDSPVPEGIPAIEITEDEWLTCINNPGWRVISGLLSAPAPISHEEQQAGTRAACETAIQQALDAGAQAWGYDDMKSAVGYIGDPCRKFDAEATALRNWRSQCWVWASDQLNILASSPNLLPAPPKLFVAQMPAFPARPTAE